MDLNSEEVHLLSVKLEKALDFISFQKIKIENLEGNIK